jgi:hypothetical protein
MPGHVLRDGEWVPYNQGESHTSFAVEASDVYDPFNDEEPLECGLETPEVCESCQ